MSKIKDYVRRFIVSFIICCTIFLSCVGDFLGVRSIDVYATSATGLGIEYLMYVIEAALASYGYSCSSQADLQSTAEGYQYYCNNYPEDLDESVESAAAYVWKSFMLDSVTGSTGISITPDMFDFLKDFVYDQVVNYSSATVSTPIYSYDGLTYADISSINSYLQSKFTIKNCDSSAGGFTIIGDYDFDSQIENRNCFFYGINADGSVANFLFPSKKDAVPVCVGAGLGFKFYSPSSSGYVNYEMRSFKIEDGVFLFHYNNPTTLTHVYNSSNYWYRSTQWTYTPIISSKARVYPSVSVALLDYKTSLAYPLTGKLYGSSSVAKTYAVDESGNITIPTTGTYTAAQVEQAIADALAANPSASQADLDAVAAQIISSNAEIEEEIGASTETLASMIEQVEAMVQANAIALADLNEQVSSISVVNGTSAEKIESIADQFEVIEGGASSDPDNDEEPKIWVPIVPDVVKFLEPLLDFLGDPLSEITKFLNKIVNQIENLPDDILDSFSNDFGIIESFLSDMPDDIADALDDLFGDVTTSIEELPDNMADAFREFFGEIVTGIQELPQNIANALPAIEIPAVNLPDAIDYTDVLNEILASLQNAFLIDTEVLSAHIGGLKDIWSEKIPFMDSIASLYDAFNFSDDYNYPVIKMSTPDILSPYFDQEYIILIDFENYKKYTLWCRNIVKAWLWFCFGLSIINHFRTNISIG